MASGQRVIEVINALPPASSAATRDVRAGGSSPGEAAEVFDFDASAIEYMDFLCRLAENYAGGGLTFVLPWSHRQCQAVPSLTRPSIVAAG